MVKRLRHRPFTAVTRVRFPVESPNGKAVPSGTAFILIYAKAICVYGGIGRRTRFRFWRVTVWVRVPLHAPTEYAEVAQW